MNPHEFDGNQIAFKDVDHNLTTKIHPAFELDISRNY